MQVNGFNVNVINLMDLMSLSENSVRRAKIDETLVKMLATDLQPATIVEDEGFRRFLKVLDPKYEPPSRRTIMRERLPNLYSEKKRN